MLRKKVKTKAAPPMVGVGLAWDDRPLGMSSIFVYLISSQLIPAETEKRKMIKIIWGVRADEVMGKFYITLNRRVNERAWA